MPEDFILFRSKHDAEFRTRLSVMYPDKYPTNSIEDDDLANEWWNKFCSLSPEKLELAKNFISENQLKNEYTNDEEIQTLLEYYRKAP